MQDVQAIADKLTHDQRRLLQIPCNQPDLFDADSHAIVIDPAMRFNSSTIKALQKRQLIGPFENGVVRLTSLGQSVSKQLRYDDTAICDACDGSGFGVADTYCGKCGGAGGIPMSAVEANNG